MKSYLIKMTCVILVISGFLNIVKEKNKNILVVNVATNNLIYKSELNYLEYEKKTVYEGLTLEELGVKIDKELNSTLDGYGQTIASMALEQDVDPVVAASIILLETGCKWNCSGLVNSCNNVGGMVGRGCNGFAKFDTLEGGIKAFITNLSNNYYKQGLTTPELINKKYATSKDWYLKVNRYVEAIKAN